MKKIIYSILLLCSLGCANIIPPQGGPMDNIAPSIMYGQCIPDSLHLTNYKEKTIIIAINEEFKIQGLNTEMKTNPALIKPVEYKIKKVSKKKSNLIITFQEELKTNTTYTLDFGRSIKDLTENNVLQNPNFVFSTGNFIDSLYIEGQVTNIYSKPIAGTLIGLYSKEDSIIPNKHKPVYSTFSDSKGNYSLTHLAEDDYQIFAIADKNKNKNYDIRNEKIGFIRSKINPSRDTNKVNFVLFQQRDTVFRITSFKLNSDKTQLKFSNGLKQVSIISETIVSHQLLNNSKTLAIFPHSSDIKESMLHIIAKDSNNNVIDTNIALKFTLDKTLFN